MKTNKPNKKSQRPSPLYNKLPKRVTRAEFNRYIKPYLSVGSRGPVTKISSYKIFNYILKVLHTGMQWYNLDTGRDRVSWQMVYHHYHRWSTDSSFERVFVASLAWLHSNNLLELFALHGDGSNAIAKKGVVELAIPATSTSGVKKSST
jgi:hypothetical protein